MGGVDAAPNSTLVTLQSVEDGEYGRTLDVIWEVEPSQPMRTHVTVLRRFPSSPPS